MMDLDRLAPMLRAARPLGRLVAFRLLSRDEALDALLAAAEHVEVRGDRIGWRVELAYALTRWTTEAEIAAGKADFAIRRALAPLLIAGAPSAELLAAAQAANAAAGGILFADQVAAIVRNEIAWQLRRGRRARG